MTWVKICGITNLEDALMSVEAGADALGFVFYEKSPRYLEPKAAQAIIEQLPKEIDKVGVFANASAEKVKVAAAVANVTAIQVYVDPPPVRSGSDCEYCFEQLARENGLKLMPVLPMRREHPEKSAMMWNREAVHAFLLDSGSSEKPGGTGCAFDWSAQESSTAVIRNMARVIVAGGLMVTNVTDAMHILKPWGVDVASGVEVRPGKKDPKKVRELITAVRQTEKVIH
jgi:phosphoribosylanthranilate isomerase